LDISKAEIIKKNDSVVTVTIPAIKETEQLTYLLTTQAEAAAVIIPKKKHALQWIASIDSSVAKIDITENGKLLCDPTLIPTLEIAAKKPGRYAISKGCDKNSYVHNRRIDITMENPVKTLFVENIKSLPLTFHGIDKRKIERVFKYNRGKSIALIIKNELYATMKISDDDQYSFTLLEMDDATRKRFTTLLKLMEFGPLPCSVTIINTKNDKGNIKELSDEDVHRTYYSSGTLKKEQQLFKGKPHGVTKSFYSNGVLQSETWYEKGKKLSKQNSYFKSGTPEFTYEVSKDSLKLFSYYRTGELRMSMIGLKDSVQEIEYYRDGNVAGSAVQNNRKYVGKRKCSDGRVLDPEIFCIDKKIK